MNHFYPTPNPRNILFCHYVFITLSMIDIDEYPTSPPFSSSFYDYCVIYSSPTNLPQQLSNMTLSHHRCYHIRVLISEYNPTDNSIPPIATNTTKTTVVHKRDEEGDGLHTMLPCEALMALATFTKCSRNTVSQRSV